MRTLQIRPEGGTVDGDVVVRSTPGTLRPGIRTAVGAAPTLVLPENPARTAALIQCIGPGSIVVGVRGVTATTGLLLAPGEAMELGNPNCPLEAIWAIRAVAAAAASATALEVM